MYNLSFESRLMFSSRFNIVHDPQSETCCKSNPHCMNQGLVLRRKVLKVVNKLCES